MRASVVIALSVLLCARTEDALNTTTTHPEQDYTSTEWGAGGSPQPYKEDALLGAAPHALYGQWARQRVRHTPHQMAGETSSAFGVSFIKCAQLDAGGDLRVTLLVSNPEEGHDLWQLCIHDSVSELTLVHTHSHTHTHLRESEYQTFSSDTLTAGSQFVVLYRMSVKANTDQALNLPAFLTFSNTTQNDIHLFGPVEANFTLMVNTPEQTGVRVCLLLLLLLLLTLAAVVLFCRRMRRRAALTRSGVDEEAEPDGGESEITALANEEAEFEDKFVDIVLLEDPQNMNQALDSVLWSCVCRAARAQECVRVQLFRAVVCVLLSTAHAEGRLSGGSERRLLGVLRGQMEAVEGKVEEQRAQRVEELMEHCKAETQEEMEELQRTHLKEEEQAEELSQHCTTQEAQEVRVWLEQLQRVEQGCVRRRLQLRHQRASAHTLRQQALQRRDELHRIWVEELEEARRSGQVEESSAHQLLLQYYTCQDTLEEVLDVLLANQRAQLAERHAHRRFLLQSLQSLQSVTSDAFSSSAEHTHSVPQQCSNVRLEILRIKQDLEECVKRERRAIRCDIIKRRRQILSEKVCEHRRQQQQVFSSSSQLQLQQFLHDYTDLLIQHSRERAQLLTQLDEETAARARKLSVCALQRAVVQLKACVSAVCPAAVCVLPQVQLMQECVQCVCEAAARELQCAVSRIRLQHQQELQQQRSSRGAFREYCSCLCVCVPSLSPEQSLRLHLECVKAACRLDRCLALHHTISESSQQQHPTDPSDPAVTPGDPAVTPEGAPELTELQVFRRRIQERLRHSGTLQQEESELQQQQQQQQRRVCEERLAVCVSALQWEQAEATARLTETHSTLLKLQTLLTAHTQDTALTHTLHTHRLALEEAELRLQQKEVQWAESEEGQGRCDEEVEQGGVFMVNRDSSVSALLQEALWKRQQVQRWTHRNQTLEHQEQQLQVNRLQVYCEQDLAFTAALVRQSLISVPDLHEVLRLLLPTGPEGELLSLMDALGPREEEASGCCRALAHTLKQDVLSRSAGHAQHTHRETQRLMKKRQQCLDALLSTNTPADQQRRRRRTRDQPEAELTRTHDNEGACPVGVAQGRIDTTVMHDNEGACPVGVAQGRIDTTIMHDNEGVCPVGVAQGRIDSTRTHDNEGAWPLALGSIDSSERLFVFRCAPPTAQQHTHKKKRSFLNFKKSSVAPQPHT